MKKLPEWLTPEPWLDLQFTAADVQRAMAAESPGERELAALLSPVAAEFLEPMAQRAQAITIRNFWRTI
jgi:2-iminoacetate synthase